MPVEGFPWSGVEFGRDGGEIGGGVYRQIGAIGKVLAPRDDLIR